MKYDSVDDAKDALTAMDGKVLKKKHENVLFCLYIVKPMDVNENDNSQGQGKLFFSFSLGTVIKNPK